jgi:hypothetical protein
VSDGGRTVALDDRTLGVSGADARRLTAAYSGSSGATGGVPGGATPPRAPTSTEP